MMIRLDCLLVSAAVFQVISSQGPKAQPCGSCDDVSGFPRNLPHKCAGPPPNVKNPQECCQVSPIFTKRHLTECGFEQFDEDYRPNGRPQGPPQGPPQGAPQGPPDCKKQLCLLRSENLLRDDNSVDYTAVRAFLDKWVESNPEFREAVETAKTLCASDHGSPGPALVCDAIKVSFCTAAVLFNNCPTWQNTEECTSLKEHMDECWPLQQK